MYLRFINTHHLNKYDNCVRVITVYQIKYRLFYYIFLNDRRILSATILMRPKSLRFNVLVVLFSYYRRPVVCRTASSSLFFSPRFFLCEEKSKRHRRRASCARALAFLLVSKQHNAYYIHIQRYKTIENDDDKKKRIPYSATERKTFFVRNKKTSVDPPPLTVLSYIINRLIFLSEQLKYYILYLIKTCFLK